MKVVRGVRGPMPICNKLGGMAMSISPNLSNGLNVAKQRDNGPNDACLWSIPQPRYLCSRALTGQTWWRARHMELRPGYPTVILGTFMQEIEVLIHSLQLPKSSHLMYSRLFKAVVPFTWSCWHNLGCGSTCSTSGPIRLWSVWNRRFQWYESFTCI